MAVWSHERLPSPPFVLEKKKKKGPKPKTQKMKPSRAFPGHFAHFLLGPPEPGLSWGPAAPPSSGFLNGNLVSPVPQQSCISAALNALALPMAFRKWLWALISLFFSDPSRLSSPEKIGKTHPVREWKPQSHHPRTTINNDW